MLREIVESMKASPIEYIELKGVAEGQTIIVGEYPNGDGITVGFFVDGDEGPTAEVNWGEGKYELLEMDVDKIAKVLKKNTGLVLDKNNSLFKKLFKKYA